jgi:hypothetical protein
MDAIRDVYDALDPTVWALIGLAVATILTLQAVETAVEGAWPHQRRPGNTPVRARAGQRGWGVVALLLLVALVLSLLNLAVIAWQDLDVDRTQWVGAILVALAWGLFLLATTDRTAIGRYLRALGAAAPAALSLILLTGGILLLVRFLDILPPLDEVRDALPL